MFDRLIITLVIVGGLSLLWLAWQSYRSRLVRTIQPSRLFVGKPTLLYFTAGYCLICKAQQSPIVAQVAAKFGDSIAVKQVDVSERPDLASHYKVLTLPTTVVLDSQGQVTHINYGVAHQSKLEAQLL